MRAIICLLAVFVAYVKADSVFIPRMYDTETPILEDGEIALVIDEDTRLVRAIRHGDGTTPGGVTWLDKSFVLRTSPVLSLSSDDFRVTLGGSAVYSNGLIAMFPPTTTFSTNVTGVATVSVISASRRLISVTPESIKTNAALSVEIDSSGRAAVITATHAASAPMPGGGSATYSCAVESFSALAYADPDSVGTTQDMRGVTVLVPHPDSTTSSTNESAYRPVSVGWYEENVPASVGLWSGHPATDQITQRAGMRIDDGIVPKHFTWSYQPNGFLTLAHDNLTNFPVISIESIDPTPWIVTTATGAVSTLVFTTNGISGTWVLQTCTDLSAPAWTNAVTLSTNSAAAGYMSLTASNILGGSVAFWRANCIGGVQQEALVRFGPPVRAPRFELDDGVYLFWSNDALRVHSGGSNGVVSVSW